MSGVDYPAIREIIRNLKSDHDAMGSHSPTVAEIFTPQQHANALDPNTHVVVGARGTGKSFWAGVLNNSETRIAAAQAYPRLGLEKLIVTPGYLGVGEPSRQTLDSCIPPEATPKIALLFWQATILRAARLALEPGAQPPKYRDFMTQLDDSEDAHFAFSRLDQELTTRGQTLLVIFDALDTVSREWNRSSRLVDALFEVIWSLRAFKSIKAKVFIRPEQLEDESLRFVELPKLRSEAVKLLWLQPDLFGLLFTRMATDSIAQDGDPFGGLQANNRIDALPSALSARRQWPLARDRQAQRSFMAVLAGQYMGKTNRKGNTYDWPYNHLADGNDQVTPRSFLKLFNVAAAFPDLPNGIVLSPAAIRNGLREASKVRLDQLDLEYRWVKRALAPLSGLQVPSKPSEVYRRWNASKTMERIMTAATDPHDPFLPPFPARSSGDQHERLANQMKIIGVIAFREDGRIDMPDLFRVAARMLKKGGVSLSESV